jgi:putative transposase
MKNRNALIDFQVKLLMASATVVSQHGRRHECCSQLIPRYQRRTGRVDEANLGVYLSGTNTRRLRGALAPLLRGTQLSKDAVVRFGSTAQGGFCCLGEAASRRAESLLSVFGYLRARIGKRRVRVPMLVTLAACADGRWEIVNLACGGEKRACLVRGVHGIAGHKLGAPVLAVIDGNPGLAAALSAQWLKLAIQRRTKHTFEIRWPRLPPICAKS